MENVGSRCGTLSELIETVKNPLGSLYYLWQFTFLHKVLFPALPNSHLPFYLFQTNLAKRPALGNSHSRRTSSLVLWDAWISTLHYWWTWSRIQVFTASLFNQWHILGAFVTDLHLGSTFGNMLIFFTSTVKTFFVCDHAAFGLQNIYSSKTPHFSCRMSCVSLSAFHGVYLCRILSFCTL